VISLFLYALHLCFVTVAVGWAGRVIEAWRGE